MLATQVYQQTNLFSEMSIDTDNLTPIELQRLFIEVTDHLKSQGVFHKEIAREISHICPRMNYGRYKNLRIIGPPNVRPDADEVNAIFTIYKDRLKRFIKGKGEPTEEQQKLESLEERIEALERSNKAARVELIRKIELLEAENELLKSKLKDQ